MVLKTTYAVSIRLWRSSEQTQVPSMTHNHTVTNISAFFAYLNFHLSTCAWQIHAWQGITADDVVVQTITGGRGEGAYPGDFVDAKLADHSLEPIITGVDKSSREISPHALAVDHSAGILYYSDVSARSIERVRFAAEDGEIAYDGLGIVEWGTFLPNVGLVYGMAVDAHDGHNGGFLYFSDAQGGTISRVELPAFDGSANSVNATSPHGDVEVNISVNQGGVWGTWT